jgi:THO complex subunit 4
MPVEHLSLDDIAKRMIKFSKKRRGSKRGKGSKKKKSDGYGASRTNRSKKKKTPYSRPKAQTPANVGTEITITNLDPGVTEDDVKEIFQKIGKVKSAIIHYDVNGKSRGTAAVKFSKVQHAVKAVNEYKRGAAATVSMFVKHVAVLTKVKAPLQVKKKKIKELVNSK